ncbi:MAG: cation:proton antiporter, partial [Tardiphaga sp.]
MASPINIPVYSDVLVLLGTAGIVIPLVHRFGFNPVLGYLIAGALLGPLGLGSFIGEFPFLYWFSVVDAKNVAGIAELGIVFLLFLIGMELSYERLKTMRRLIFGLGSLQIALSATAIAAAVMLAGGKPPVSLIIGACLALSSTAIVVELLSRQGRLNTTAGRASFAVLLAQDLAVAPLLLFISIFGAGESGSAAGALLLALGNAAVALGVIVFVGRVVMRPLFRLVASAGMNELFVATTLFVIVAAGVAAATAGFSMALGAFVAGLLLAETEFRKAIETAIDPFKGLLLGLFFFTVGMNIDFRELARDPVWLLGGAIGLIAAKSIILIALARLFRLSWRASIETGLLLGPGGEFAFVGIGMATTHGLIDAKVSSFTVALTSLTMLLIPAL